MTGNDVILAIMENGSEPTRMTKISETEYEVLALDGGYEPVRYRVIERDGKMEIYYK